MVIAVNTLALQKNFPEGYGNFIGRTFSRLAEEHPEHSFIFVGPETTNPFFKWWWTTFSLPKILKKNNVDLHIHKLINNFYWVNEKFQPLHYEAREQLKEKYAEGNEYFFCSGNLYPEKNLIILLKAFSLFKKRQKSGMQLLITDEAARNNEEFFEGLRLFKFRDDVKVLMSVESDELAKIAAASYATVYPSTFKEFEVLPLESMRAGVPALTSNDPGMIELCGDAAIYFDVNDPVDISQKMMMIYKDEEMRKQFIEKGNEQVKKYSWENSSERLLKEILGKRNADFL